MAMNLSFNVGDDPDRVRANRSAFFGSMGVQESELAVPGQVHGKHIERVEHGGRYPGTDGLITRTPRVFLCVTFADCVPILLFDPVSRSIAGIHAGWRGTVLGIVPEGIRRLAGECGAIPERLRVYLGPAAGACCYEVGEDVARRFEARYVHRDVLTTVDLHGALKGQLLVAGCLEQNIEISPACTIHDLSFHSFRRDGRQSGRMMAFIGLPEQK
jgi:YfiH family protein